MITGRVCTVCKVHKDFEHFNKCSTKMYGVQNRCRECCKLISKRDRLVDVEKARAKRNAYYASKKEYLRNKTYEGRAKNPDRAKKVAKKSYNKHQTKRLEEKKEYYVKNRELVIAKVERYAEDKQYEVIYRHMKYGSKKRGFGVLEMTFEEFVAFRDTYKKCYYCPNPLPQKGSGMDRINNNIGYLISNVVPCCTVCNRIRGDNLTHEEMKFVMTALTRFRAGKILD